MAAKKMARRVARKVGTKTLQVAKPIAQAGVKTLKKEAKLKIQEKTDSAVNRAVAGVRSL